MKMICVWTIWTMFVLIGRSEEARILGVFPIPSLSHQVVYREVMLALNRHGHEIVIVTTDPIPHPPHNYTQIDIGQESYQLLRNAPDFSAGNPGPMKLITSFLEFTGSLPESQLKLPQVQRLLQPGEHFDLFFMEWIVTPVTLGFSYHFQVPTIGISSMGLLVTAYDAVGSPTHPAYLPDFMHGTFKDLTFWEKVTSAIFEIYLRYQYYSVHLPRQDKYARGIFGEGMPYLGDLERNVSLLMSNTHFTTSHVRPLVPAIVQIGGPPIHLGQPQPLPQDLQEFLDMGTEGVIYFSMGTNMKCSIMPESKRTILVNAFRKVNLKVLWKWDSDDFPDKPDNVKLQKWLPQADVLAHPNVKLFITQGGLQSIGEAIHYEKPMVVFPIFGDQPLNAMKLESVGAAVRLEFETMTTDDIVSAIDDVINNPKYTEAMRKYCALTKDQPESPMERAVWWTEYVLRHNGAHHLRSAAVDMPWYQYFMLDVLAFLLALILASSAILFYLTKLIIRTLFSKSKPKTD